MSILVLHRVPFAFLNYSQAIDHVAEDVIYVGASERIADLPGDLRCRRLLLADEQTFLEYCEANKSSLSDVRNVVSASAYTLREAALIREMLGARGMYLSTFDQVDDKVLMKQAIEKQGLRIPRYVSLTDFLQGRRPEWVGRTVLKPRADTASHNVFMFDSIRDVEVLRDLSFFKRYGLTPSAMEIEEFVPGRIHCFDGYALNSEVPVIQGTAYYGTCFDYAQGKRIATMQVRDDDLIEEAKRYVLASGIHDGVFHLELFKHEAGATFLEIAPRTGGAAIHETMLLKWNVDLHAIDIALQAGTLRNGLQVLENDMLYGSYIVPGHKQVGKTCTVKSKSQYPAFVLRSVSADPAFVFTDSITYIEGEVPLYLILQQNLATSAEDMILSLDHLIDLEFHEAK